MAQVYLHSRLLAGLRHAAIKQRSAAIADDFVTLTRGMQPSCDRYNTHDNPSKSFQRQSREQ
eukprot:scaffold12321_cov14-Prasinocladus_malaysianus.AAC.1